MTEFELFWSKNAWILSIFIFVWLAWRLKLVLTGKAVKEKYIAILGFAGRLAGRLGGHLSSAMAGEFRLSMG